MTRRYDPRQTYLIRDEGTLAAVDIEAAAQEWARRGKPLTLFFAIVAGLIEDGTIGTPECPPTREATEIPPP